MAWGSLNTASSGRPNNVKICGGKQGTLRALCDISKHEELLLDYGNEYMTSLNKRLRQAQRQKAEAAAAAAREGMGGHGVADGGSLGLISGDNYDDSGISDDVESVCSDVERRIAILRR